MSRILLVANDAVGAAMAGPAIRCWELAHALHDSGSEVVLASPGRSAAGAPFATVGYGTGGAGLREAAARCDALVIQGLVLSHHPFLAALDTPIVVDIYDPFVLENLQARAGQIASGRQRHHDSDLAAVLGQLRRGDFFICASEVQRDFWLGMLAALGRVNPSNYDADPELRRLIDVVPFGIPREPPVAGEPAMRGVVPGIAGDDFVLLWGGGIWSWLDPLTPIRAMAEIAERHPEARLYFMGGRPPSRFAPAHAMADRAASLARELGLVGRSVFFAPGWVPYDRRAAYLLEANAAISCHLPHIESRYAFRTRLLDAVWAALPMIVTAGDALAELVEQAGLGEVVPPSDVGALASAVERLMDGRYAAACSRRFAAVQSTYRWSNLAAPLAAFAAAPHRAADGPMAASAVVDVPTTPLGALPRRSLEVLRDGGGLLLLEEIVRYVRWRRRGH